MKEIELLNGMKAFVDDEDYERLVCSNWSYAKGYAVIFRPTRYMHRIIMAISDHSEVDHINGVTLDNRKENLRVATHRQNMMNRKKHKVGTSKFKGVAWDNSNRKWIALTSSIVAK